MQDEYSVVWIVQKKTPAETFCLEQFLCIFHSLLYQEHNENTVQFFSEELLVLQTRLEKTLNIKKVLTSE